MGRVEEAVMSVRTEVAIKRVYEPAAPEDGLRVLVDRLWPRGVSKAEARLDEWAKDVAPSPELRKAWHADPEGHEPEHFRVFSEEYRAELADGAGSTALDRLVELARSAPRVTLLYGAKDEHVNHAVVLRDALQARLAARS